MAQPIEQLVKYNLPSSHYDPALRNVIESHRLWLRNQPDTKEHILTEAKVQPFKYNLFLYLKDQGIPVELHWPILLINDLNDPSEFTAELGSLLIPSTTAIESIVQIAR